MVTEASDGAEQTHRTQADHRFRNESLKSHTVTSSSGDADETPREMLRSTDRRSAWGIV